MRQLKPDPSGSAPLPLRINYFIVDNDPPYNAIPPTLRGEYRDRDVAIIITARCSP